MNWSVSPTGDGGFFEASIELSFEGLPPVVLSHTERFKLADDLAPEARSIHPLDRNHDRRWNVVTRDPLRLAIGGRWTGPVLTPEEALRLAEELARESRKLLPLESIK